MRESFLWKACQAVIDNNLESFKLTVGRAAHKCSKSHLAYPIFLQSPKRHCEAMMRYLIIILAFGVVRGTPLLETQSRSITPGGRPVIDFGDCPNIQVVTGFQTSQYLGEWYAAYANPTFFQSEKTACSMRASSTSSDFESMARHASDASAQRE